MTVPPYYLAYFNQMVGGPLGAKQKGFESTYWLDAITPDMIKAINREIPPNGRMARWGIPDDVLSFYQKQGLLRRDIGWDPDVTPADTYILAYARQGFIPSFQKFEKLMPVYEVNFQGVPLVKLAKVSP